jgi:predicted amino acid racemase
MKTELYTCVKQTYNIIMGIECWSEHGVLFFIDQKKLVKVGDKVRLERNPQGLYSRMWVNGILCETV